MIRGVVVMSETWFPVINYDKCNECGACVAKCSHGVYDKEKGPLPIVVYPDGGIQGCHGCGNLCPNSAISYFGEYIQEIRFECCDKR